MLKKLTNTSFPRMYGCSALPRGDGEEASQSHWGLRPRCIPGMDYGVLKNR